MILIKRLYIDSLRGASVADKEFQITLTNLSFVRTRQENKLTPDNRLVK